MKKIKFSKKFKLNTFSIIFTIIFIAIIVVLNLGVSIITNQFNLKFDLTDNKIYNISTDTSNFLKNYQNKANIFVLDSEDTFKSQSIYSLEAYNVLKNMVSLNSNITLSFIDLDQNPNFSSKYSDITLQTGGILITDDNNHHTYLSSTDLFSQAYDSTTKTTTELLSNVEESVAHALEYITGENPVKAVVISGHNETDISSFTPTFQKNGYSFDTINLINSDIAQDTSLVIIASPTQDYSLSDIQKIENYLNDGGALVYFASSRQGNLPNIENLLSSYGITFSSGTVVETDPNYILNNSSTSFCIYPYNNEYTNDMADKTLPVSISESKPMNGVEKDGYTLVDIASTQESCINLPLDNDNFDYSTAEHESFPTVIGAKHKIDDTKTSKVTAFSSVQMFGSIASPTYGNGGFILSVLGETSNHHSQVNVLPKSIKAADLGATLSQIILIAVVFLVIIPLLTILICAFVNIRRRLV